jgi:outer membrane protein TolC
MEPGRYRVRLLSKGLFGARKPMSGWIPIDVRKDARKGQAEEVTSEVTSQVKLVRDEQAARADVDTAQQQLARVSALYKDGLAPDDDVVEAQIEVAEARLRLSAAQQQPRALMLPDLETLVTLRERRYARATELYKAGLIRPEDVSVARGALAEERIRLELNQLVGVREQDLTTARRAYAAGVATQQEVLKASQALEKARQRLAANDAGRR